MSKPVRVRFAPSPTGLLHVGGARTALFNYLYAKAAGGKFLLRIEDTDTERSEDRFTDDILGSLKWMGLQWDEEPIYQSKRFERYKGLVDQLLEQGKAFRCGYSEEELEAVKAKCRREKRPYRYPGFHPDKVSTSEDAPIRIKMPKTGETTFHDLIRGAITIPNSELDDWIICRSNGVPTYNFCVVVDDADQEITHILRGEDHINNTPKQIHVYEALGLTPPQFGHVPMILGSDRSKLSKRHGAGSTLDYRSAGYLPGALVNFLVRLGWSYGDQEIFTLEELERVFNLENIGRANAIFNTEKLEWVSGKWMESTSAVDLLDYLGDLSEATGAPVWKTFSGLDRPRALASLELLKGKVKTCLELLEQLDVLFGEDPGFSKEAIKPKLLESMPAVLKALIPALKECEFSPKGVEDCIRAEVEKLGMKFGQVGQCLRFAVSGGRVSPELFDMLSLMGKERVLRRLQYTEKKVVEGDA